MTETLSEKAQRNKFIKKWKRSSSVIASFAQKKLGNFGSHILRSASENDVIDQKQLATATDDSKLSESCDNTNQQLKQKEMEHSNVFAFW